MSDGITDMYRAMDDYGRDNQFLICLADYLTINNKSKRRPKEFIEAVRLSELGRAWLFEWKSEHKRNFAKGEGYVKKLRQRIKLLEDYDRTEWRKLLSHASKSCGYHYNYIKKVSPYKDKVLVFCDYVCGGFSLRGDMEKFVSKLIRSKGDGKMDDCMLALNPIDLKKCELEKIG